MPCSNQDLMWILFIFIHGVRPFVLISGAHSCPKIRYSLTFIVFFYSLKLSFVSPNMYPLLVSPTSHDFRTFPESYFHSSLRQDRELS